MKLIDSHCHLHDSEFYDATTRERVYREAIHAGVAMICVGMDVRSSHEAVTFAELHDNVWAVVGIHPHEAATNQADDIRKLLSQKSDKVVGIGEIGLDYHYDHSPREVQLQRLREQLRLAVAFDLPVSFHVRDAFDDFWPVFDEFSGIRGVLHSFTDTQVNLDAGFARGLYMGINGISTFTKDTAQQTMYRHAPLERVLLETDAPYLTPIPFRGKVNIPAYVRQVAEYHARARDLAIEEAASVTTRNARQIFGINYE